MWVHSFGTYIKMIRVSWSFSNVSKFQWKYLLKSSIFQKIFWKVSFVYTKFFHCLSASWYFHNTQMPSFCSSKFFHFSFFHWSVSFCSFSFSNFFNNLLYKLLYFHFLDVLYVTCIFQFGNMLTFCAIFLFLYITI